MAWNLASVGGQVTLQTSAENLGAMAGTLTVDGIAFNVSGEWANGQGGGGRDSSCFEVAGQHGIAPNLPIYIGAAGNMVGAPNWPQSVEISGAYCSVKGGVVNSFHQTLLPMLNTDQDEVRAVYSEIGCQLNIQLQAVPPYCSSGTINGKPMTPEQCGAVCTGGIEPDPLRIVIPKSAPNKPVGVLLLMGNEGADHFRSPVLAEFHSQITKILYDTTANGLLLEYSNTAGTKHDTHEIVFNGQQRKRPHLSIIIKPQ